MIYIYIYNNIYIYMKYKIYAVTMKIYEVYHLVTEPSSFGIAFHHTSATLLSPSWKGVDRKKLAEPDVSHHSRFQLRRPETCS